MSKSMKEQLQAFRKAMMDNRETEKQIRDAETLRSYGYSGSMKDGRIKVNVTNSVSEEKE